MRGLYILLMILYSCGGNITTTESQKDFDFQHKLYQTGRKIGINKIIKQDKSIDYRLKEFVEEFEMYYGGSIGDIGVHIKQTKTASCVNYTLLGYKEVVFPFEFLHFPKEYQKIIIFHELGHCVLNQFHNDCSVLNIMCAELSEDDMLYLYDNLEESIDMLFNGI